MLVLIGSSTSSQSRAAPFRNVTLSIGNRMIRKEFGLAGGEKEFGLAGGEHLTQSLIDLSIDKSSDFFAIANLSFSDELTYCMICYFKISRSCGTCHLVYSFYIAVPCFL